MFFKLKSNVIFRNYVSFGYITDNRNFGYKKEGYDGDEFGEKILSESGAAFLSVLGRKAQSIDELAKKIKFLFKDVDRRIVKNDAREFYCMLERDGFIVSGETPQVCDEKDTRFSYNILEPEILKKDLSPSLMHPEKSTQDFFKEYFKGRPQLTSLHIEITSKCNERCVHCYIPHDNKVSEIEPDLFYNVLNQCKNMRLLHLT
ncbi:MAG: radical SAM protein, partial [Candidatus Cloacimonetes bacterium]|nr:radical SAM protein [Candidatus Cloacimonadota bacterium]